MKISYKITLIAFKMKSRSYDEIFSLRLLRIPLMFADINSNSYFKSYF